MRLHLPTRARKCLKRRHRLAPVLEASGRQAQAILDQPERIRLTPGGGPMHIGAGVLAVLLRPGRSGW